MLAPKSSLGSGESRALPGGEFFGTLCGIDRVPHEHFDDRLADTVGLIASLLSLVIAHERAALVADRHLSDALEEAKTDALTGVANRRGWDERLEMEEQRLSVLGDAASVVVIDLDDLKEINDHDGHAAGDVVLQQAAEAIRACVRNTDYVARVGGDEFMILAIDCDRPCVDKTVERVAAGLSALGVEASIGSAVRQPDRSLGQTQELADQRMYERKRASKALQD